MERPTNAAWVACTKCGTVVLSPCIWINGQPYHPQCIQPPEPEQGGGVLASDLRASLGNLVSHYLDECPDCAYVKSPCSFHYWLCYLAADEVAAQTTRLRDAAQRARELLHPKDYGIAWDIAVRAFLRELSQEK